MDQARRRRAAVAWRRAVMASSVGALAAALWPAPGISHAAARHALLERGRPTGSVFHIAKSENKNQVHYGVRVDDRCQPRGSFPVYGYWREFEEGPNVRSPLLKREVAAYGVSRPKSIERNDDGGRVRFALRGFPDRTIVMRSFRAAKGCRAQAVTRIAGADAVLQSMYVELGFLFSIDYVLLKGVRVADGRPLEEKVED